MKKPLLTIVVPVYNEEKNVPLLYGELKEQFTKLKKYNFEVLFVDDGSHDNTVPTITKLASKDKRIRYIGLSRNFGKEIATTAGLNHALGAAAIMIDADLQHPVALLPQFIARWQDGAEVVVGVRKRYKKESLQKRLNSWLFYQILNSMAEVKVKPRATDYRLLDRVVLDEFNRFSERNRITRGLIDWLGFRREYIYFDSPERLHGKAGYGFKKLVRLAINSFVSLSLFPLRIAGWLGIVITVTASILGAFVLVEDILLGDPLALRITGPAILAVINMFLIGIVLMSLGLIALYIGNIHSEVIGRPLYVARVSKNAPKRRAAIAKKDPKA